MKRPFLFFFFLLPCLLFSQPKVVQFNHNWLKDENPTFSMVYKTTVRTLKDAEAVEENYRLSFQTLKLNRKKLEMQYKVFRGDSLVYSLRYQLSVKKGFSVKQQQGADSLPVYVTSFPYFLHFMSRQTFMSGREGTLMDSSFSQGFKTFPLASRGSYTLRIQPDSTWQLKYIHNFDDTLAVKNYAPTAIEEVLAANHWFDMSGIFIGAVVQSWGQASLERDTGKPLKGTFFRSVTIMRKDFYQLDKIEEVSFERLGE